MISLASVQTWLDNYIQAWRTYDRAQIEALYTEDALCYYNPFDEPLRGRDAILESWLDNPDDPKSWEASYHPLAVEGHTAVTQGRTTYLNPDGTLRAQFDNIFVLRFSDDGRVAEFTEWYMQPRRN
ncbi:MAG: nuclear transport factor 2 family protein [Anaerolinea sp.]|nr:nuclear transport factor 2 family protein [Anaerolinea sp.]